MSCADERSPPMREYLLFDDQPASATPYTPIADSARMTRTPLSTSAIWRRTVRPNSSTAGPIGMTEKVTSAGTKISKGASR